MYIPELSDEVHRIRADLELSLVICVLCQNKRDYLEYELFGNF